MGIGLSVAKVTSMQTRISVEEPASAWFYWDGFRQSDPTSEGCPQAQSNMHQMGPCPRKTPQIAWRMQLQ